MEAKLKWYLKRGAGHLGPNHFDLWGVCVRTGPEAVLRHFYIDRSLRMKDLGR